MKTLMALALGLVLSTQVFANSQTRRFLLSTLQSRSSLDVQLAAVHSLRDFSIQNDVERSLLLTLQNQRQPLELRQAAVEALVPATRSSNLTRRITAVYLNESSIELKETILRSLWLAASSNSTTERFLYNVIEREPQVQLKRAALFGLMATVKSSNEARVMMNILANQSLETSLRIEALKSLYFYRNNRVEDLLKSIAFDRSELSEVRSACLRMYMTYPISSSKTRYLTNLAQSENNEEVKIAALDALRTQLDQDDLRFFHLFKNPKTGELRNPLLD